VARFGYLQHGMSTSYLRTYRQDVVATITVVVRQQLNAGRFLQSVVIPASFFPAREAGQHDGLV
jgi:hypothetical protein